MKLERTRALSILTLALLMTGILMAGEGGAFPAWTKRLEPARLKSLHEARLRLAAERNTSAIPVHGVYDDFRVLLNVRFSDAAGAQQIAAAAKKAGACAVLLAADVPENVPVPAADSGVIFLRHPSTLHPPEKLGAAQVCNCLDSTERYRGFLESAAKDPDAWKKACENFAAFPDEFFGASEDGDLSALDGWERECEAKPVVAVGACCARQAVCIKERCFDPYEVNFRHLSTHVLAREGREAEIREALRAGHAYASYDWLCDPTGFLFGAGNNFGVFPMGDTVPTYGGSKLVAFSPVPAKLKLIHNGAVVNEVTGTQMMFDSQEPGAYRLEAWLTLDGEERPWIITNPVYLKAPTVEAISALKMPSVEISKNVDVKKDITYIAGKPEDEAKHKLDLYIPKNKKPAPVFFFVHGGAWRSGDRALYFPLGGRFAKEEILTVVPSYRLAPLNPHPAQIEDVAAAFAWTVKHIAEYGGDPNRIYVGGHSAGGHLSALLALDERWLKKYDLTSKSIRGAITMSGVYDLVAIGDSQAAVFGTDKEARKDASPLTFVKGGAPPFVVTYCQRDYMTLPAQAKTFYKALRDAKIEAKMVYVPGENHISEMIAVPDENDPTAKAVIEFVK